MVLMLVLAAVTVWTGAFGGESTEDLHEIVAWTLLAMVGVHILAVVIMSVLQHENLVRSMVSGTKPALRHPDARDAHAPTAAALLLAAIVVAGAAYGILRYDPQRSRFDRPRALNKLGLVVRSRRVSSKRNGTEQLLKSSATLGKSPYSAIRSPAANRPRRMSAMG